MLLQLQRTLIRCRCLRTLLRKKKKRNHLFVTCSIESVYCGPMDGCDFAKALFAKKKMLILFFQLFLRVLQIIDFGAINTLLNYFLRAVTQNSLFYCSCKFYFSGCLLNIVPLFIPFQILYSACMWNQFSLKLIRKRLLHLIFMPAFRTQLIKQTMWSCLQANVFLIVPHGRTCSHPLSTRHGWITLTPSVCCRSPAVYHSLYGQCTYISRC